MFTNLVLNIKNGWHLMRVLRLALAIIIIVQSVSMRDIAFGVLGVAFLLMALFNWGCCGTQCYTDNTSNTNTGNHTPVDYEEIK